MNLVALIWIVGLATAGYLALNEKEGWGWILFVLFCSGMPSDDNSEELKKEISSLKKTISILEEDFSREVSEEMKEVSEEVSGIKVRIGISQKPTKEENEEKKKERWGKDEKW